jgi:hypothetical protein
MGMMLYLRFWWECSREAWHGSWSRANALAIFGGAILAASAWWLRLTKEAPSSIEGAVGFAPFHRYLVAAFGMDCHLHC